VRWSDGRSDDGTFKNLYNNDLTTEGTARVILPVLVSARLALSLSLPLSSFFLSFPRVLFPSLRPSHLLSSSSIPHLPPVHLFPDRERERKMTLFISCIRSYSLVYGCSSSFKLCSEVLSSSSSFFSSFFSFSSSRVLLPPLPLHCRLHLLVLCAGTPLFFARELANVIRLPKIKSSSAFLSSRLSLPLFHATSESNIRASEGVL